MAAQLSDKVVIITGAGGGIGTAAVDTFLAEGAAVVALDLPGAGLEALRSRGADGSTEALLVTEGDVASAADWQGIDEMTVDRFGAISGLVNNAGIEGAISPIVEYPEAMFDLVLDVNIKGVWLGMKTAGPAMADGASIVNVSSVAGLMGAVGLSAYSASKHAVIGLTRSAAKEFAPQGIRCNAICPSPIRTRMMEALEDATKGDGMTRQDAVDRFTQAIPLARYGQPDEVAALMAYLLSDQSQFVTGTAIPIDGAMTA